MRSTSWRAGPLDNVSRSRVGEEAPGQQGLSLPWRQLQDEPQGPVWRPCLELRAAVADRREHARDPPFLALRRVLVVGLLDEREGRDSLRDQVRAVDAREALRDDRTDAEVERRERSLLAARALAVVVTADDDPAAQLRRARGELGVEAAEHVLRAGGDVRPDREPESAVGRHVAGRDVVRDDDQDAPLDLLR